MSLDTIEVVYTEKHFRLLEELRREAIRVIEALTTTIALDIIVHGSIARGDVKPSSDIDVVILQPVQPVLVVTTLEKAGYRIVHGEIIKATPRHTPKVYLYLDYEDKRVVSFPLAPLSRSERDFYKWGGELDLEGLKAGRRMPGVTKELKLVIPTSRGHIEEPVIGNEDRVASLLGISVDTVRERVRVLTRRREHGRTGVYFKLEIDPSEPVEQAIMRIRKHRPDILG